MHVSLFCVCSARADEPWLDDTVRVSAVAIGSISVVARLHSVIFAVSTYLTAVAVRRLGQVMFAKGVWLDFSKRAAAVAVDDVTVIAFFDA